MIPPSPTARRALVIIAGAASGVADRNAIHPATRQALIDGGWIVGVPGDGIALTAEGQRAVNEMIEAAS